MSNKPSYQDLEQRITFLENESNQRHRYENINMALFKISNAINSTINLDELFRLIHCALTPVIDTTNFYIALYDDTRDSISFPYIVDSVDETYPTIIDVSKTASLTAEVIVSGKPLMITKPEILAQRAESPHAIPSCTPPEIWLGVPLQTKDDKIGAMVVQSYDDRLCYDQTDLNVLVSVADQVAIALDRKNTEQVLLESEERFRHIVATANEGILIMDAEWIITYANAHITRLFGHNADELIGMTIRDFVLDEDLEDFLQRRDERIQGRSSKFERRFKTSTGDIIWTIVSATSIFDSEGQFAGSFGMITDITALKNVEAALQEKVKELRLAVDQIKTLRGIIPICMSCKKIRDDKGFWSQVEEYVRVHTEAEFSHGICPECLTVLYPDLATDILKGD